MFAAVSVCSRKIENGTSGSLTRRSHPTNARRSSAAATKTPIVFARAPAPAVALRDAEHEEREPGGHEHGTRDVEALTVLVEALREQERREDQCCDADRDVHEEDPFPRQEVDEDAAEQDASGRTDTADRSPRTEGDVALATLGEHRHEDRQSRRGKGGRAEALQCAERDQRFLAPREPAEQRAESEDERAGHEDAPASEEVGRTSAEEEESSEHQRVGADDPLQVLLGEPEVDLDRRQRDVDDRDVEDGHELHREDQRECEPLLAFGAWHSRTPVSSLLACRLRVSGACYTNLLAICKLTLSFQERRRYTPRVARCYDQYCPMAHALDIVGERWSLLIVRELLEDDQLRYSDLHSRLPGCGTNILAARLKTLESGGVVRRRQLEPPAASWVYELTEYGRGLREVLHVLAHWGARSLVRRPRRATSSRAGSRARFESPYPSRTSRAGSSSESTTTSPPSRSAWSWTAASRRRTRWSSATAAASIDLMVDRDLAAVVVEGDTRAVEEMLASLPQVRVPEPLAVAT